MKPIMKHTILERKVRIALYVVLALASLGAILGLMSLALPIPEDAMMISCVLAVVCGYYTVGLRDADQTIYKSQHPVTQETSAIKS